MGADPIYSPGTPAEYMAQFPDFFRGSRGGVPPGASGFQFQDTDRWTVTATNGGGLQQGDPTTLTWGIVPDGTPTDNGAASNLIARLDAIYGTAGGPVSARPWFPIFQQVFDNLEANSGIDYVYQAADDGARMSTGAVPEPNPGVLGVRPDVRIGGRDIDGSGPGVLAFAFFPNLGDITFDTNDNFFSNTSNNSLGLRNVLAHEEGHGVGLDHSCPTNLTKLMEPTVTFAFDGPQHDDLLAINRGYGDRLEPNDNVLTATDLGVLNGTTATVNNVSIDDDGDADLYRFSATGATTTTVSLNPFGFTYLSGPQNNPSAPDGCSAGTSFDSNSQSDLSLEVLDSTGAVIANVNANGLGAGEVLTNLTLPAAGDYFVRLRGAQNAAQFYTLSVNVAQAASGGGKSGTAVQLVTVTADDVVNTPRNTFDFVLRRSEINTLGGQPALDINDAALLPDPVNDIKSFTLFFDGALDEVFAEDEANYDLRSTGNPLTASDDGLFDTGDDFQFHVTPRYITTLDNPEDADTNPDFAVVLQVQLPAGLITFPSGRYRLTVRGGDPVLGANNLPLVSQSGGADEVFYLKAVHRPTTQPPDPVVANILVDVTDPTADTAPGAGTAANPYNDIQTALAAATAGDVVLVRSNLAKTPYVHDDLTDGSVPLQNFGRDIVVPAGVRLVFQQGTIVKLRDAIVDVSGAGAQLDLLGTFDNPVVFTSYEDELPTTGTQTGIAPQPEDWGGIVFRAGSDSAGSQITFAEIRYTGGEVRTERYGAIHGFSSQPVVTNTIITSAGEAAFEFDLQSFSGAGPTLRGNFLERNSINGVFVLIPAGTTVGDVTGDAVTFDDPVDHIFTQSLTVPAGASVTATNTNLKFSGTIIELQAAAGVLPAGALTAINTHFTSIQDDSTGRTADEVGNLQTDATNNAGLLQALPGDWGGIDATAAPILTILSDVGNDGSTAQVNEALAGQIQPDTTLSRVAFGGGNFFRGGIQQNLLGAIDYRNSNAINLQGTTVESSMSNGVFLNNVGGRFLDNDFLNNANSPISIDPSSFHINRDPVFRRNVMSGNSLNGVVIRGGTFSNGGGDEQLQFNDPDAIHVISGDVGVGNTSGLDVLTIDPGIVVKFSPGAGMVVNGADPRATPAAGSGALVLNGDPDGAPYTGKSVGRFSTAFAGLNNDLVFTARQPLPLGNLTVRFLNTGVLSASVVPLAGGVTRIEIGIDPATSTAKDVRDVVLNTRDTAAVVHVRLADDSDGSGLVAPLTETPFVATVDESPVAIPLTSIADDTVGTTVYRFGQDGRPGRAGVDDDSDGITDEGDELGTSGSDDVAVPQFDVQSNGSTTPSPAGDYWDGLTYSYFSSDLVFERDGNGNGTLDPWEDLNSNGVFDQRENSLDWRAGATAGNDVGEDADQDGNNDLIAGNVVNYIDLRFAADGIVHGGTRHSPFLADALELGDNTSNPALLGSLGFTSGQTGSFQTPDIALRGTGILTANDVDFFSFTAFGGIVTLDIDHTNPTFPGLSAVNTSMAIYYRVPAGTNVGKLVLLATSDTDVNARDLVQPRIVDPFMEDLPLPGSQNNTYYVAVYPAGRTPNWLISEAGPPPDYGTMINPIDGRTDVFVPNFDNLASPGDDTFVGTPNNATGQYTLYVRRSVRDVVYPAGSFDVTNSQIRNITGDAIRIATPEDTSFLDKVTVANNMGGNSINSDRTLLFQGVRIENNELANIGDDAIQLTGDPVAGNAIRHDWVLNNTVFNANSGLEINSRLATTVLNNIFANNRGTAILSDGSSLGTGTPDGLVVSHNLFHANAANGFTGTLAFPNAQSPASDPLFFDPTGLFPDLRIPDASAAVDSSLSDLQDRLFYARIGVGHVPETLLAPERVGRRTALDRNQIERIDLADSSNPNLGLGEDPFFDIGANEATDFRAPEVIQLTLATASDTGEVNEVEPRGTRQSRPTFRGLVVDFTEVVGLPEADEVAGLVVDIDVDDDGYDDGTATTSLFFDPETGLPVFYNVSNRGLVAVRDASLLPSATEFRRVGVFEVQPVVDIPDDADLTVKARVTDKAGRASPDKTMRVAVDTVRPGVLTVTSNISSSNLLVEFDEQMLLASNNVHEYLQLEVTTGALATAPPDLTNSALVGGDGTAAGDLFGIQQGVNDFVVAPLPVAGSDGVAFFRGPFNNTTGATRPTIAVSDSPTANLDLTGEFTLSLWAFIRDYGAEPAVSNTDFRSPTRRPLLSKRDATTGQGWALVVENIPAGSPQQFLVFEVFDAGGVRTHRIESITAVPSNEWVNVALSYNPATAEWRFHTLQTASAVLDPDGDGAGNDRVQFVAAQPGAAGNNISVAYALAAAEQVTVVGNAITVEIVAGTTTANRVLQLIAASPAASQLVFGRLAPASNGSGIISRAVSATALVGGQGPTIVTSGFTRAEATIDTATAGVNDQVRFRAVQAGAAGNAVTVQYIAGTPAQVSVAGNAITVRVAATTTAAAVVQLVNAHPQASQLVLAELPDGTDGTGVVAAPVAATALTGGVFPLAAANTADLLVGAEAFPAASATFDGFIDEVQVWNRDLSFDEITQLPGRELPRSIAVRNVTNANQDLPVVAVALTTVGGRTQATLTIDGDPTTPAVDVLPRGNVYELEVFDEPTITDLAGNPINGRIIAFGVGEDVFDLNTSQFNNPPEFPLDPDGRNDAPTTGVFTNLGATVHRAVVLDFSQSDLTVTPVSVTPALARDEDWFLVDVLAAGEFTAALTLRDPDNNTTLDADERAVVEVFRFANTTTAIAAVAPTQVGVATRTPAVLVSAREQLFVRVRAESDDDFNRYELELIVNDRFDGAAGFTVPPAAGPLPIDLPGRNDDAQAIMAGTLVSAALAPGNSGAGVVTPMDFPLAGGVDTPAAQATLTTSLTGTNNDLVFTAVPVGAAGNGIRVQYVGFAGTQPLSLNVDVTNRIIVVNLETVAGTVMTTAQEILDLLQIKATDLGDVADRSLSDFTGGSDLTIAADPATAAADVDFYRLTSTAVGTLSLFMNLRDPNGDGQLDDGVASGRDERLELAIVNPADPLGPALATATPSPLSQFLLEMLNQPVASVGQEFFVRVRGVSAEAANAYDVRSVNEDRFELATSAAPVGDGLLPDDPDGRNDVIAGATDLGTVFTFAEDDLTITLGDGVVRDTDFFRYTAPDDIVFNVFAEVADINRNGTLDAAETLGLEVLDPTGTTVLATGSVFGTFPGSVIVDSGFVQLASGQTVLIRVFGAAGVANSYNLRALADDRFDHPFRSGTVDNPSGMDPAGRNDSSDDATGAGADAVRRTDLGTIVHLTEDFLRISDDDSHNFLFTAPTPVAGLDGQTFTIDDGLNPPTVFEFDNSGGTALGRVAVNFAGLTTADQLAAAIRDAINAVGTTLNAAASGNGSQVAVSGAIRVTSGAFSITAAHDGDWFRVTAAVTGALDVHVDLIDADSNSQIDAAEILGVELYSINSATNQAGGRLAVGILDVAKQQVRIDGYPATAGEAFLVRVKEGLNLPVSAVSGGSAAQCNLQPMGPPVPGPVGQPNHDLSSGPFNLGFTFEFFGNNFTQFFVNNNGNITFTNSLSAFTATGFPNAFGEAMVAPFWADVDTRGTGSGVTRLAQGTNPLTGRPFIQVDWPDVGYFSNHVDKLNDFTLYIEDDPLGDLICFDYRNMEWTTGDASGGTNGFGGTGADIGFDAGDGVNFISLGRPNDATSIAAFANRREIFVLGPGGVPQPPPSPPPAGIVNASSDGTTDQVSPSAAINPLDTRDVVSVAQSVDNNTGASVVDVFASTDGGQTFTRTRLTSTFDALGSGRRFSPDAAFDANGNLYVAYAFDNGTTRRVVVTRSTDQGTTFGAPSLLAPLGAGAVPETVSIATGRDPVGANQQNVFVAWSEIGAGLGQRIAVAGAATSNIGGPINPFTFTITKDASSAAGAGQQPRVPDVGVDRAGRVFATWVDYGANPNPIRIARDDNFFGTGLAGFGSASVVTTNHVGFRRLISAQPQRGVSAMPSIAFDRSDPADPDFGRHSGRIYIAYTETGLGGGEDLETFLRFSDDGGATWSRAQRINQQNRASQWGATIAVDSTTGQLFATWLDTRRDAANVLAEPFIAQSIDGGLTFQLETALATLQSNQGGTTDPVEDFGDRLGLAATSHVVFVAWPDNTTQATDLEVLTNRLVETNARNFYNLTIDNADRRELQTVDREFDAPPVSSGNLYASTDGVTTDGVAGPLATLNEFTGAGTVLTVIDALPALVQKSPSPNQKVAGSIGDIDFSPTGELVGGTAFANSSQPGETLVFIDPDTGLVYDEFQVTGVGLPTNFSMTAVEFQPGSGALFVAMDFDPANNGSVSRLGRIDIGSCSSGSCTVNILGQTNVGEIGGLAFNPISGQLYGVTSTSSGGGDFVVLNTATGAAITTTPSGRRDYTGLEFGPDGLTLYGVLGPDETVGAPGDLVAIDPFTGQASLIGPTGLVDPLTGAALANTISGVSFRPRRNERPEAGTGIGRFAEGVQRDMTLLEGDEDWYRVQAPVAGGLTIRVDLRDSATTDRNADGRDNDGDTLVDEGDEFVFGVLDAQEQLGLELRDSTGSVVLATGVLDDLVAAVDGSGFGVFIDHEAIAAPTGSAPDPFFMVRVFAAAGSFNEYDLVVKNNDRFDQTVIPSSLFGADAAGQLVTINASTGLTTAVGPLASVPNDIEFHPRDILLGESGLTTVNVNDLVRIDPATGDRTVIGRDGTVFRITALEFDETVGSSTAQQLFATTIVNDTPSRTSTLVRIDPNTGQVTNIGATGTGEITGLAFAPEPATVVVETEPNDSVAGAQNIDGEIWTLNFDLNIGDTVANTSTTIPHVTIAGTGNLTADFYSFTVANAGDRGIFDIDFSRGGLDSYVRLIDSGGNVIGFNDDSAAVTEGQDGSTTIRDSYLEVFFPAPGTYFVEVGRCCPPSVLFPGEDYRLQVSIENHIIADPVLYGVTNTSGTGSSLVRLDTTTGAALTIGPTGFADLLGLDFDPTFGPGGTMFAVTGDLETAANRRSLVRIDTATGVATRIGTGGALGRILTGLTVRPPRFGNDSLPLATDLGFVSTKSEPDLSLPSGEEDWYTFVTATPGRLEARIDLPDTNGNGALTDPAERLILELFGSDGTTLLATGVYDTSLDDDGNGVAGRAHLRTTVAGANNDLRFTAVAAGAAGNLASIEFRDPGAANQALSVATTGSGGNAIVVTLATNATGTITSTAQEVIDAIRASAPASALVTVAGDGDFTSGAGVMAAMPATNLIAGDLDDGFSAFIDTLSFRANQRLYLRVRSAGTAPNLGLNTYDLSVNIQPDTAPPRILSFTPATLVNSAVGAVNQLVFDLSKEVDAANVGDLNNYTLVSSGNPTSPLPLGSPTIVPGAIASLATTNLPGTNDDLAFAARVAGTDGDAISVAYVVGTNLSVSVAGSAITVTVVPNTRASEVRQALLNNSAAAGLVQVTLAPGNDGSGFVSALPATNLTGGAGARVTIPISPVLVDELYTFTIDGTTPSPFFTDNIGNRLDGEFGGALPSGNGAEGGDFVYTFKQDTTPATIDDFDLDAASDDNPATPHDGAFADDNRTADSTPNFTVAATDLLPGFIAGVRADIDVDGDGFDDGSCVFAGAATATTASCVVTSTATIPDVVGRQVTVRLTDTAGNTSTANVTIDVDTQPINDGASTFDLSTTSDDAPAGSVAGDDKTNDSTPSFAGNIRDRAPFDAVAHAAGLVVLLDADGDGFDDGQDTTDAIGNYTVTSTTVLADGDYTAQLQVVDGAGNTLAAGQTLRTAFTVDTTGPRVVGLTPFPGTTTTPTQLVVTFDAADVNPATLIAANFRLVGVNSGDISNQMTIAAANLVGNTFTIPLTGIIASDLYTFTIEGDTSVEDEAGNRIDGEFNGAFPSGNGTAGGDFTAQFTVDSVPPEITSFILADVSDIQTQPGNTGTNINDDRTDDATPVFSGTVADPFPGSLTLNTIRIDLDVDGDGFDDGSGFADAAGNFAVTVTTPIAPDTASRVVRARATDSGGLGNVSDPPVSTTIGVDTQAPDSTFELRRDDGAVLPTNRTNDTTPSFGGVFTDPSPFGTAADLANVTVELDVDGDGFDDGSDQTDSTGAWQLESTTVLAVAAHPNIRVRFSDKVGHEVIKSIVGGIEVETTAPRVTSITPLGLRAQAPTTIVVEFNESMLNVATGPLFAHSVRNPANVELRRSGGDGIFGNVGDVVISLTNFAYSENSGFRLTITPPLGLPDDQYRFTIDATSSLRDQALNRLDGEFVDRNFTGTQDSADLPSGDGVEGGNFVVVYTVDTQSPAVTLGLNLSVNQTGPDCPEFFAAFSGSVGDTGILCDRQTNLDRPFLSGRVDDSFPGVDGNLLVELDVDGDGFDDTTNPPQRTRPDGTFLIQPAGSLPDGTSPVTVRVTDLAGNAAIFSTNVIVDRTAPPAATQPDLVDTSDSGLLNNDNNTNDNTPTLRGSAEAGSTVALFSGPTRIGTGQADSTGAWVITTDPLTDGLHNITAQATDAAGNSGPASPALPVTIDTVAPGSPSVPDLCSGLTVLCTQVSDTGSSNVDNITNDNTPQFVGTRGAAGSTISLTTGGQTVGVATPNTTGGWAATVTQALADGVYDFQATATDLAGNVSQPSGSLIVTIDGTIRNPSTPDLVSTSDTGRSDADNITNDNTPELTGTADAGVTVSILSGQVELANGVADNSGNWTITLPFRSDGTYSFTARARDIAGNTSGTSQAISVVIDTVIAAPRITGISTDNGVSATDGETNDPTLVFSGTAEPDSKVTLSPPGGPATADTDSQGNWFFNHTATTLAAGTHPFTATATDVAGNVSSASVVFSVMIDVTPPPVPSTATLADDTGIRGDGRTNRSRPALRGTTGEAGTRVEVLDAFNRVVGAATAGGDGAGSYTVQLSGNLVDGPHNLRIRSTDAAGNSSESAVFTITVDTTPLRVLAFTPAAGTLTAAPTQFIATLNGDDVNSTALGDPAFAGSLQNPANYSLVRSGGDGVFGDGDDVVVDISNSRFEFIPGTKQLVITLQSAPGVPLVLGNDTYRFTINGVGSLEDIAGNAIDGDNNGAPGGNFTATFGLNVPAPRVIDIQLASPTLKKKAGRKTKVVQSVTVFFDRSLDPATAQRLDFFDLRDAGADGRFDEPFVPPGPNSDDRIVQLSLPIYTEDTKTVLLNAVRAFSGNRFLRLVIKDDVRDLAGGRIDGNGNGASDHDGMGGTDHHTAFLLRGNNATFRDANGDLVNLGIRKIGTFDVILNEDRSGRSIRLENVSTNPKLTQVFGSVAGGDGRVHFDALTGSAGIDLSRLPRCTTPTSTGCFDIGTVSAQVVDRALDSGDTAASLLADSILHATPRLQRRRTH